MIIVMFIEPSLNGILSLIVGFTIVLSLSNCKQREVTMAEDKFANMRKEMVRTQIIARGVSDTNVLTAMSKVERHRFVPKEYVKEAYNDYPLPIGMGQTISQPYVVAAMTEALDVRAGMKVLEIGTGSGYQSAILAEMGAIVKTIEIIPELAEKARETLRELGYHNVEVIVGDGYLGLPQYAPFDRIIITAAPPSIPDALVQQLAIGGKMVLPVGTIDQDLILLEKTKEGVKQTYLFPVRFVPMVKGRK